MFYFFFMLKEKKNEARIEQHQSMKCVPIICMKTVDLFFEIIISSLPGNHDPEPTAFQL